MHRSGIFALLVLFLSASCFAQKENVITPDLTGLLKDKKITIVNRNGNILSDANNKNGIHLDAKGGDGVAWLNDVSFSNGTIEFDVKGKNVMQQSFVGLAFHGLNDSTMDVVYFRPFNFLSEDAVRRSHSVQYVSLPVYDWQKLRTEFPDKYEHAVNASPQPNDWFHVRLVIKGNKVSAYVNNNSDPDLTVEQLSNQKKGMVGFWVGNNSDGDFANLKINSH